MKTKILTVSEALIALGNGEKITSDMLTADDLYVSVVDGKLVYRDGDSCNFNAILCTSLRIYQEFTYPMWFKSLYDGSEDGFIARFDSISSHEVIIGNNAIKKGKKTTTSIAHTSTDHWKQVEGPKKMIKVALFAVFKKNWYQTQDYYIDEKSCLENHSYATMAKRLDYTEIEVPCY